MAVSLDDFSTVLSLSGRATRVLAERVLNEFGLHAGQQFVLECLWEQDGLTVGELAARIQIEVPTLTRTVRRMEPTGVVERRADDQDGRRVRIWLTAKGWRLRDRLRAALRSLEDELLTDFTADERKEFVRLLRKLHRAAVGDLATRPPVVVEQAREDTIT